MIQSWGGLSVYILDPVVCVCMCGGDDDEGYRTNFANIIPVSRGRTEKAGGVREGGGDDDCDRVTRYV